MSEDFEQTAVQNVYLELTRKLCNTRLQEFIDVYRRTAAKKGGSSTIACQNLRAKLLTYRTSRLLRAGYY